MNAPTLRIGLNDRVQVELVDVAGKGERGEFTLVPADRADIKSGLLDENAPLAKALLGHTAGETIPYRQGDLAEVRILKVERGTGPAPVEAARKRRAAVRKAEAQSAITDQMIFANASGSKWGAYDVDVDKLLGQDQPDTGEAEKKKR